MNEPNVPTREDHNGHALVINTEIGSLSNHHALTFTIGPPQEEIPNLAINSLNWKHVDKKEFCDALKNEIKTNRTEHETLVRDLLNQNRKSASESKLDEAVRTIQNYLE